MGSQKGKSMDHILAGADTIVLSLGELDLATLLSLRDTPLGSILQEVVEQKVVENDALKAMNWRDRLIYKDLPHAWHSMHHQHHMHHMHHQHHMHHMHHQHHMHHMHHQHHMHHMHHQHHMHHSHSMSRW